MNPTPKPTARTKTKKKRPRSDWQKLRDKLDRIFSKYIRLRDRIDSEHSRCISCGKIVHWKSLDNGHFIGRQFLSLRWNEKNCNAQCKYCNNFKEGNKYEYGKALDKKYGAGTADKLEIIKSQKRPYNNVEMQELIKHYEKLVKEME